jgi:hypothetical protein
MTKGERNKDKVKMGERNNDREGKEEKAHEPFVAFECALT